MSYAMLDIPPGGIGMPWGPQPPHGGGAIHVNPILFIPGQLPSDTGGGTPAPGDTQIGYPEEPETTAVPTYTFAASSPLTVRYLRAGASASSTTEAHGLPPIRLYLGAGSAGPAVPGSVRFAFRGRTYVDRSGSLYYGIDPITNTGTLGGSYDYANNVATLTDYASGSNTVTIVGLATRYAEQGSSGILFRTTGAPIREGSFTIRATTMAGVELTATADINGDLVDTGIKGHVDWNTGLVRVAFGAMVTAAGNEAEPWYDADLIDGGGNIWRPTQVDPASVFFGAVVYRRIPVDPDLVGIDPVRLPSDGRVLGFNVGTPAIVSHTAVTVVASPVAGATTDLGRERLAFADVYDSSDPPEAVEDIYYTLDLDAGTLEWADPLNLSAYTLPINIRHRIQDAALISDVQITGQVSLASPVTHDYPAGTILSNALAHGDMQARYNNLFDQLVYQAGVWSNDLVGSPAGASYNDVTYPIAVANEAAIDERWAIVLASATTAHVIGETVGQVLTGVPITDVIAPLNPASVGGAVPYFTIDPAGWGGGWSAGNVLRFNTVSATRPIWAARVTLPGTITVDEDAVRIQSYGNAA